jgi:predicted polyphosphate/ATP-dependent NAD kinase
VQAGEMIGRDLNEEQLLELIELHHQNDATAKTSVVASEKQRSGASVTVLLSPMGGQGFLIGRGNLQLSPAVLRAIGIENVLGVVTPAKMATLSHLRIDSGDVELDEDFRKQRYIKALQGYRTTRLVRVAED